MPQLILRLLTQAGHGVVIQNVPMPLRVALAILLTGLIASAHYLCVARGWADPKTADTWADTAYGSVAGIFAVSVVGTPKDDGKLPGVNPSPPPDTLDRIK